MRYTLKTKFSLAIAMVVLLTVAVISFLTNYLFEEQFGAYMKRQQDQKTQAIAASLSQQYSIHTDTWNVESIHTIGMSALYEGYIIKVFDQRNRILWDAQAHDMSLCTDIMEDISIRMENKYPEINGDFTTKTLQLDNGSAAVGSVKVIYFGPFFLNESDFQFLDNFNTVLGGIALFSLLFSVLVGVLLAKRISTPILKTVDAAKQISDGDYSVRILERPGSSEVDMLMHSINDLAESLQKQEVLRKQLTADVAHELRTPIAIVQAQTEAMLDGVWAPTAVRLQSCHDEITRMGKLVNDLENLAKADADNLKLKKTEFNFLELVDDVITRHEADIKQRNLKIKVDGHETRLYADWDRMSQVVINLLANAVKYSEDGGEIGITILETQHSVVFAIQDNGIGIPEEEQPLIFERFYRSDKSRARKTGGSGIGLAIVKSIVEAHGGKVSVKSQVNQGSCFEVVLPKVPKP